jgi:hypothetical protein
MLIYIKYAAVVIAALLLGRWFDQERKKLKKLGEPSHKAWLTPPGVLIIVLLVLLVGFRLYLSMSSGR